MELRTIARVITGVPTRETEGAARVMRLSDLSDLLAGRKPLLATGEVRGIA